jgi:RNA polymerase sigma factor (sigma-70 family)
MFSAVRFMESMSARNETQIGGGASRFPSTRWSLLREARDRSAPGYREAIGELCRRYWKPAYTYLRSSRPLDNEQAKDLTQQFLLEIVEGDFLSRFSPDHGSFRGYLRGALRLFLLEERRGSAALKRGGERTFVPVERHEPAAPASGDPDALFDRQWADSVLEQAVEALRDELATADKEMVFRVFDRYELNPPPGWSPSYAELCREFSLKETDISNYLVACRKRLRELIVLRIRDYVTSAGEVASELLRLFSK